MELSAEELTSLAERLSQLAKTFATSTDPESRRRTGAELVLQAKKIVRQSQDPFEALMDHIVNGYTIGAALALVELGVFESIPAQGTAKVGDIAAQCNADEELITRLMRQLTCVHIFDEVNVGEWAHNRASIILSSHAGPARKSVFLVAMEEMLPSMVTLNQYVRKFGGHSLLHTYTDTPHSWYNNKLGSNFWEVLSTDPKRIDTFSRGLSMFEAYHPVIGLYPFQEILAPGNAPDRVLAVDIGGGRGAAMLEIRRACPSLQGKLILQDRDVVLEDVSPADLPGVVKMPHDFFQAQPIKNAQIYYIRRVMHDWQDVAAARILRAIVPSMGEDSRILVSDNALPEPVTDRDGAAVWMDMMMLTIGGKERTISDWQKLADRSGLRLVKVWMEPEKFGPLCVVEYMLPEVVKPEVNGVHEQGTESSGNTNGAIIQPESADSQKNSSNEVQV